MMPATQTEPEAGVEIEWTVHISGQPLAEMAPATREAMLGLMDAVRAQAEAMLIGEALPAPSPVLVGRMRTAIARWDQLAKAEKTALGSELPADIALERIAREDFEDAFNILIHQFEKEYSNG